ncbi:MAG: SatD family protein [Candidatus Acidiferrales bacterium]
MSRKLYGVLIADVISSGSRSRLPALLHERLRHATHAHRARKLTLLPYAVTAGDEFQTITARLETIPWLLLDLRRRLQPLSLRIGIGIGGVAGRITAPVNELDGVAFRMARQALESLKKSGGRRRPALTAFRTCNAEFDPVANLIYELQDTLVDRMTQTQWKTIAARAEHRRIEDTARAMGLNISTVSRNLKRGYYGQLIAVASGVGKLISTHF